MFRFKKKRKNRDTFRSPETHWDHYGWQWSLAKSGCNRASSVIRQGWKLQEVTIAAKIWGFRVLTVYAFSTGKLTRPEDEVKFIMHLPVEFYDRFVPRIASQQCQDSK